MNRSSGTNAEADLDRALACRQEAAAFSGYPLLFAGDTVLGYPLRGCQHSKTANQYDEKGQVFREATDSFAFAYGVCDIPPDRDSCAVPVTIIIDPSCSSISVDPSLAKEKTMVRGAQVFVNDRGVSSFDAPSYKLTVYPPGTTYEERRANAVAVVESLIPANAAAGPLSGSAPLTTPLGPSPLCP